jgi:hypothetical protein
MMTVHVHDQDVIEVALDRLFPGVGEQTAGVELFERHPTAAVGNKVHGVSWR